MCDRSLAKRGSARRSHLTFPIGEFGLEARRLVGMGRQEIVFLTDVTSQVEEVLFGLAFVTLANVFEIGVAYGPARAFATYRAWPWKPTA